MFRNGLIGLVGLAMASVIDSEQVVGQVCGETYAVRANDSLSRVARVAYGTPNRWRLIYNANFKVIGNNPALILPGQNLQIPCPNSKTTSAKPTGGDEASKLARLKLATERAIAATGLVLGKKPNSRLPAIRLLTADDYKPFTDQKHPKGGMITDVVSTALEVQRLKVSGPDSKVAWINDWAAHLDPLLSNKTFDLGFPWVKPECERYDTLDKPAKYRCDTFFFSDPLFEIFVVFFKKKGTPFKFDSDRDVEGARLCRPSGYNTFDLDKDGRNWIKDKKVTLAQPQSVDNCFEMLERGEIDAVALSGFVGRAAVRKLKMTDQIEILDRPISIENLHIIVAKTHKRAKALLKYFNEGLRQIRADGIYGGIVDRHLTEFWAGLEGS